MAILHGSWIPQSQASKAAGHFFVWGETWRRIDPIAIPTGSSIDHPFAMAEAELRDLLRSLHTSKALTWDVAEFPLQELAAVWIKPEPVNVKLLSAAVGEASRRWQSIGFYKFQLNGLKMLLFHNILLQMKKMLTLL